MYARMPLLDHISTVRQMEWTFFSRSEIRLWSCAVFSGRSFVLRYFLLGIVNAGCALWIIERNAGSSTLVKGCRDEVMKSTTQLVSSICRASVSLHVAILGGCHMILKRWHCSWWCSWSLDQYLGMVSLKQNNTNIRISYLFNSKLTKRKSTIITSTLKTRNVLHRRQQ